MIKLSLCMIVKDEEEVLYRCLSSVTGITPDSAYKQNRTGVKRNDNPVEVSDAKTETSVDRSENPVDEIIVADTGSTDKTKQIAAKFGAKIYDYVWKNDFSAARNFAFAKASCDYILWLDADDFIDEINRAKLLSLKKRLNETGAPAAFCRYETGGEGGAPCQTAFYRTRIVKNDGSALWSGRVHECLPQFKNALCDTENGFTVRHLGSSKPRGTRNLDIYRAQALAGEPFSPRDLFYYGRELFYHGFYTEADAIEEEFTRRDDGWYVNKIEARKIQSACREKKGDTVGAKNALFASFLYGAPRAGVLCSLGRIYRNESDFSSAYLWYLAAYHAEDHSAEGDFDDPAERTVTPLLEMVYCAYRAGNETLSRKWHEECLRVCPDHPSVRYNREFFSSPS